MFILTGVRHAKLVAIVDHLLLGIAALSDVNQPVLQIRPWRK